MKRIFPVVISIIMVSSLLFTGCTSGASKLSLKDSADASLELLTKTMESDCSFESFSAAVINWAEENQIEVTEKTGNYFILSKKASEAATSHESFIFHTGIDLSNESTVKQSISSASALMTTLYSSNNHGDIKGIFTLIENGNPVGAADLKKKEIKCDNFIDLTYSSEEILCNSISTTSNMEAYKDLTMNSPQYTEAYKITLSGKENQSAYKNRGKYPNAIKTVGNLLASCQSATVLFELVEFNGGDDAAKLPAQATATVVIHENDVESFKKRFDKSFESIEETYEDIEDEEINLVYTMEPVELPDSVISKEDTENIVSLIYTMINGNFLRDEETDQVMAVSNIGTVSTENNIFSLGINAKSIETSIMDDIHTTVATICGLCDIDYKEVSSTPTWTNNSDSAMAITLSETMEIDLSSSLESITSSEFVKKDPDINLIIYGLKHKNIMNGIDAIIDYMAIAGTVIPEITQ